MIMCLSQILCTFALDSIKSSRLRADSPTEQNEATVVSKMRKKHFKLQNKTLCNKTFIIKSSHCGLPKSKPTS